MPPRLNSEQFQNKVIDFNGERLGIHACASFVGCNQKTQLNSILLEAVSYFNFGSGGKCGGGGINFKNIGTFQQRRNNIQEQANAWEKRRKQVNGRQHIYEF